MRVQEMENIICEEFPKQIDLIMENAIEERADGQYKPDKGAAAHMFIAYVENTEKSPFVKIPEARARIAELKAQVVEG